MVDTDTNLLMMANTFLSIQSRIFFFPVPENDQAIFRRLLKILRDFHYQT